LVKRTKFTYFKSWGTKLRLSFPCCKICLLQCSCNLAIIARVVFVLVIIDTTISIWTLKQIWPLLGCYKIFIMSHGILTHHHPSFTPWKDGLMLSKKSSNSTHISFSLGILLLSSPFISFFYILSYVIHILLKSLSY